mgnify:FL=1
MKEERTAQLRQCYKPEKASALCITFPLSCDSHLWGKQHHEAKINVVFRSNKDGNLHAKHRYRALFCWLRASSLLRSRYLGRHGTSDVAQSLVNRKFEWLRGLYRFHRVIPCRIASVNSQSSTNQKNSYVKHVKGLTGEKIFCRSGAWWWTLT